MRWVPRWPDCWPSRGSGEPGALIGGLLPDLLGQPGFATVIADAVGPAVSALVAGQDPTVVIDVGRGAAGQHGDPGRFGAFTTDTLSGLLGDMTLWTALGIRSTF